MSRVVRVRRWEERARAALLAAMDRMERRQRAWQTVGRWALLIGFLGALTAVAAFPVR